MDSAVVLAEANISASINQVWGVTYDVCAPDSTETMGQFEEQGHLFSSDPVAEGTVDERFARMRPQENAVDYDDHFIKRVKSLLEDIRATLLEDREEGLLHDEFCADDAAILTCQRVACQIAQWLIDPSMSTRWAAFGEDSGDVSLVLSSGATKRRLDFRISADGQDISAVFIDENLKARTSSLTLDDRRSLRETAAWVHSKA